MKKLDYQINAIEELCEKTNRLLKKKSNKTIVLKAPTGAGKTIMMAEYIKNLVSNRIDDKKFSFIWAAPRKLHLQSKEKLTKHYKNSMDLKCSAFGDLNEKKIGQNEILFLNWESINKDKNIIYKENENEHYLEKVIQNTVKEDRIIMLIIDENHFSAEGKKAQELIKLINAKINVGVSATPSSKIKPDELVTVDREDVIDEEMIKKRIVLNPGFEITKESSTGEGVIIKYESETTDEFIIRKSLEKREELAELFIQENSKVNPLLLIQIPPAKQCSDEAFKEKLVQILKDKHKITVKNGKLAIYLSDDKENLANITMKDSTVEVMIFKQAISLGWSCPRASIIALFRDWKDIVFSTQTVGRIMRMPDHKHYVNDDLNSAYIFTNKDEVTVHDDFAGGYTTTRQSVRIEPYDPISLLSCHSIRIRSTTRLSPKFTKIFLNSAKKLKIQSKIDTNVTDIENQLIVDGEIELHREDLADYETGNITQTTEEIQTSFDRFVIDNIAPFYPENRTINRVKTSIYSFFKEHLSDIESPSEDLQKIVLSKENRQLFIDVLNDSKSQYIESEKNQKKQLAKHGDWEIPLSVNYSEKYQKISNFSLSVMQPFFEYKKASDVEKKFAKYLDGKNKLIKWWFKNGERDKTFFAVPRKEKDQDVPFYVDWIVHYADDKIGLFETKDGITAETAGTRAEGLATYIEEQKKLGRKLIGGIVIEKNGSFWLNSNKKYEYDIDDLSGTGWKIIQ